jgi:4'-phosphopantetheinyl transferase
LLDPRFVLSPDTVHVWKTRLDVSAATVNALLETLCPEERHRAERFHFQRDRDHCVVARGVLRSLLGHYLQLSPAELRFRYNPQGKPSLDGAAAHGGLRFNLSHSGTLALYAIALDREVGIDIEKIDPSRADRSIAENFFSAREVAALDGLTEDGAWLQGFFQCWTRKEAFIKARGEGLSLPLDRFAVSLGPGVEARLLLVDDEPEEVDRWTMFGLHPEPGYAAALVAEGTGVRAVCSEW